MIRGIGLKQEYKKGGSTMSQKIKLFVHRKKRESKSVIEVNALGSDILTPSSSPKLLTKKSRRSLNAFTMVATASPPA